MRAEAKRRRHGITLNEVFGLWVSQIGREKRPSIRTCCGMR
jgi:hypothetical protein